MTGRSDARPMAIMVAAAMLFAAALYASATGGAPIGSGPGAPLAVGPSATPVATARGPEIKVTHDACCDQSARFLSAKWESTERVTFASLRMEPAPPFDCGVTIDPSALRGTFGCVGLLPGATEFHARLSLTTPSGTFPFDHRFKTMGDRLVGVKWFTEFEDPTGEPLACAAASCRIIQLYTTGEDKMTATQVLEFGKQFNVSADPGLDPVAMATLLKRLDARNDYHYYRFDTREEATASAVYWLFRSGKPVIAITLAGQHAPLVIGFDGTYGTYYDDPNIKIGGVVVQDPQRGDMRQETAARRPDKYRSPEFQTGRLLFMDEWLKDEWWLGFPYARSIKVGTQSYDIERSDGVYPLPHWAGKYVLLVHDADSEWPSDKEGRVRWR